MVCAETSFFLLNESFFALLLMVPHMLFTAESCGGRLESDASRHSLNTTNTNTLGEESARPPDLPFSACAPPWQPKQACLACLRVFIGGSGGGRKAKHLGVPPRAG